MNAEAEDLLAHYREIQAVMARREELFSMVDVCESEADAVQKVADHFGISTLRAGAVLSLSVSRWTLDARRRIADEIQRLETLLASD